MNLADTDNSIEPGAGGLPEAGGGLPEAGGGLPEAGDQPTSPGEAMSGTAARESAAPEAPARSGGSSPEVAAKSSGAQEPTRPGMKWYVLRVASNKENQKFVDLLNASGNM